MRNPIVIVGGMGPQASVRMHELLLEKSRTYHDGSGHAYPYIAHFSLPVPDFISDESYKSSAIAMLRGLTPRILALQPGQILLACNTAHILQPEVELLRHEKFLSLVETVAQHIASRNFTRVGLLASPTTIRTNLYKKELERYSIECLIPSLKQQGTLEKVIRNVIDGKHSASDRAQLLAIADSLKKQGADAILLGCTELPLALGHATASLPVIDCLDVYATVSAQRYYLYNGE